MTRVRRRAPKQERSQATVDHVLVATARLLENEGLHALTTNRIARVAGVSVGSLYQYFPSKEAIVEALQERHFHEMGRPFLERMEALTRAPLPQFVEGLAELMRTSELLNSRLSRLLLAFPRRGKPEAVKHLESRCAELLHGYLVRLSPSADADSLRIPAFLVVQTVEALILGVSQTRPAGLNRERFTQELANLVVRYLAPLLGG
ncbi:MAG: TetR/AcrR family transcriptional regulator [Deltaproteobacteria bacterium]|nr:TetR/AcrR family transcriptional regulator [Deltaproteobacteria bacterium]